MEVVNGYLIVQKVMRGGVNKEEPLLLNDKKEDKPGIATYEVIIGSKSTPSGHLVLLNENDLLDWNKEDKIIKEDQLIMKGEA